MEVKWVLEITIVLNIKKKTWPKTVYNIKKYKLHLKFNHGSKYGGTHMKVIRFLGE